MIKFGTDGWRGQIADDFTFENVKKVSQAVVNYLKKNNNFKNGVIVGYDNRFQSEKFALISAKVFASNRIKTFLVSSPLPAPALSFWVKQKSFNLGIMITASHNPAEWNGFKIKESFGGSSRKATTQEVEKELKKDMDVNFIPSSKIEYIDPKEEYLNYIKKFVDLDKIRKANIKVVIDPMFGSSISYLSELLRKNNIEVIELNNYRDPLFGGIHPEPLPIYLTDLISQMKEIGIKYPDALACGLALDGDGDRIAAVDPSGEYLSSHNVFSLILKHLVENRGLKGSVIKTFNISRLVEKQALNYNLPLKEVPIGFKYIAEIMLSEKVLIGGEESGGIGIIGNIPERDGSLAGLMLLELMAYQKQNPKKILNDIMKKFGFYYYSRIDVHIEREKIKRFIDGITKNPPSKIHEEKVEKIENLDGIKLNTSDESWILFRPSGTEPLLRIYVEATSQEKTNKFLDFGEKLLNSFS